MKKYLLAAQMAATIAFLSSPVSAESLSLQMTTLPEWKAVYGRVETRDSVPARARIGGTLIELNVAEGDTVAAGDVVATVKDDKIDFQVAALDAQLKGLQASLENAQSELARGEELIKRGVTTAQRLDALRTQVDVLNNQIAATEAQRLVVVQQSREGEILAPAAGKVLSVPVTRDAVIMPGEAVATIGGGGFFLRLAIPERHADLLAEGASIEIEDVTGNPGKGRLVKLYPEIDNGRVIADVEVNDLPTSYVGKRLLVRVPVGERNALLVPQEAVSNRHGLDFVAIRNGEDTFEKAVVTAAPLTVNGQVMVEILTGLEIADEVVLP
ncbi:efflux RND transporter periplasmic adaptor subunit [Peteryoungia desertarenae]|uniref:Efflux RND transporter periplasmic adaptor subunit n=1 Tax=Peteryoungia desertarenae TaxID=1813451 RepID=A0ABX6QJP8_9HYPH|nr:efflux RND transporter periplasmic adaptor subunit [Peteryoungia desertarenae]QLF68712.1 efflux RND transporter periplasmic adaptor subunit [Peteryoungia desertarenae]